MQDKTMNQLNRRQAIASGLAGAAGLASMSTQADAANFAKNLIPHFAPKAKRVIYLFMAGGPSHIDLFDFKPAMRKFHGTELPPSIRGDQRLTGMTSGQKSFPCVAPMFDFQRHGQNGTYVSELLPHTANIIDDLTLIKTVNTEAVNHDPAITYINTGSQIVGKPSLGAWLSYGLGSENNNMPAYTVMISTGKGQTQALFSRLWGSGFLPSQHQGVKFRSGKQAVLYLQNPKGVDSNTRRAMLDQLAALNQQHFHELGDPEINARIAQYEMAYRMQESVPEAVNFKEESEEIFNLYGKDSKKPGTFANHCILARRLAERGVKFIQLYHPGWDQHGNCTGGVKNQCRETDQAAAALVTDLKNRGMLEETLVIWGGEFGRTAYSQGGNGRDHHPRCFPMWMAGGGIKGGVSYGETDDFSYNIVSEDKMHIHDFHATILHLLGIDHERLTFKFQGRYFRLTDVHGHVNKKIIV